MPKRPSSRRSAGAGNKGQGSNWCWRPTRLKIYARDGWRCVWCQAEVLDGRELKAKLEANPLNARLAGVRLASLDHFLARSCGGTNSHTNLLTSCSECNEKRDARSALEWATELARSKLAEEHRYNPNAQAFVIGERARILERCLTSLEAPLLSLEERSAA